jgi:hypothetical protein
MRLIGFAIDDVVEQVDRAGQRAEDGEGGGGEGDRGAVGQLPPEQQAGKHEQVLGPLSGPERAQQECRDRTLPGAGSFRPPGIRNR